MPRRGVRSTCWRSPPGAAPAWRLVNAVCPGIREAVIFRPVEEAIESCRRVDISAVGHYDFELLRRSGCEAIFYGLESGSERILREAYNKPLDLAEAERVIRQTKEAGICAIASRGLHG